MWSRRGERRTATLNLDYQDTWHGALVPSFAPRRSGCSRVVWLLIVRRWKRKPHRDSAHGPDLAFWLGAQYQVSRALNIGAACTFMWSGDMPVDQGEDSSLRGRVSGSYNDAWFTIANLNLTYRF